MKEFIINKNDAGQRLDKFLNKSIKSLPNSLLYKYIRLKRIKVNNKRAKPEQVLLVDDVLSLYINDEFFDKVQKPSDLIYSKIKPSLNIVYEDENIILVDKPQGMLCHEDDNESFNTLISHIKVYLANCGEYIPDNELSFSPALCNRIDRNTGGIVIAAKNAESLRILNEKIKTRQVKKYYLCAVHGILSDSDKTIKAYLKKDSDNNIVTVKDNYFAGSKEIITHYKVLKTKDNMSLLEIELITGRTHQIRAHMAHIGHPLVGDGKYGSNELNKKIKGNFQHLYSYKLQFDFDDSLCLLNYLNGKTFSVKEIDFTKNFN